MDVTPTDRARQLVVTLSEIACVVGTLYGVGILGTPVEESSGGSLSADATLLAPASSAFSIWSVIYAGLAAFTVWQWMPRQAANPRLRVAGWLAAASMLLNASWLLVTQQGWIWASLVVILLLLLVLVLLMLRLGRHPRGGLVERIVVDGTFGLYLGWVSIATWANLAAALSTQDVVDPNPGVAEALAVGGVVAACALSVLLLVVLRGRLALVAAMAWGLGWIAAARLWSEPHSPVTAAAAALAVAALLGTTAAVRARTRDPLPVA